MSSLSEEIQRLSELFASGALSKEEFKAAKEVTIKSYTPLAATAPLLGEVGRSREEAEVHTPFPNVNISEFGEDAAGQPQRERHTLLLKRFCVIFFSFLEKRNTDVYVLAIQSCILSCFQFLVPWGFCSPLDLRGVRLMMGMATSGCGFRGCPVDLFWRKD
ncbi:hypothetical protein C4B63_12g211 [Trypanosoma cruzi]|uniref:SHOCT domain-containing protein n=1 Tax=Trypanosoma cruzi TaxID=5693 RepID=A0A2V2VQ56_TRYCR|nr:hypothetical protein C4B63_12g211 [Trypanosoma cruzi]